MKFKSFALAIFTFCAVASGVQAAQAVDISTVTTQPISNGIHATFGPDGSLYLPEGGIGGDGSDGRCTPSPASQFVNICAGNTGGITRIKDGVQERIFDGLPSLAQSTPERDQGAGPADLQFDTQTGKAYIVYGMAGDPRNRDGVLNQPELARLYEIDLNTGGLTSIADFAQYEIDNNPDGTDLIVNPFSLVLKDGFAYVTDGGANVVYKVGLNGEGIVKANALPRFSIPPEDLSFPSLEALGLGAEQAIAFEPTQQSVPTGIKLNPKDGHLYITEYTFFPYPEGKARVWKADDDLNFSLVAEGFTQLTDLEFDDEGNMYLLQQYNIPEYQALAPGGDRSGSIIRVSPDGTREVVYSSPEIGAGGSLTKGPDGAFYVTAESRFGFEGQVRRIELPSNRTQVPEPTSLVGIGAVAALGAGAMLKKRKRQEELLDKVEIL